jgi:protein-disulfide isomerase
VKINKLTLGAVAAVVVGLFVLAANMYTPAEPVPAPAPAVAATPAAGVAGTPGTSIETLLVRPYSPTLGPEQAAVTIVEFFDPECESCSAMHPIVKQVMSEFEGKVRLVIRYMPLHDNAVYSASLLEAARAQNKYWEYLEIMMLRQAEWASHAAPRPDLLLTYAPLVGLNVDQLKAAASDPQVRLRITQDERDGTQLGANKTPTFFINGAPLMRLGYEELRDAVRSALQ